MLEREPDMNPILVKHVANGNMKALTKCHPKNGLYPFFSTGYSQEVKATGKSSIDCLTNIYELIRLYPTSVTLHIQEKRRNEQSEHQTILKSIRQKDGMRIV